MRVEVAGLQSREERGNSTEARLVANEISIEEGACRQFATDLAKRSFVEALHEKPDRCAKASGGTQLLLRDGERA